MCHARVAAVVTGTFLIGAFASVLFGHGGDTTRIHACVAKDGTLRIVTPATACRSQEAALDWNIQGPQGLPGIEGIQGLQGEQGLPGEDGAPGDPGPRGPSDAYVTHSGLNPVAFESNNEVTAAFLTLPEGNYTLSGKVLVGNGDTADAEISCRLLTGNSVGIDLAGVRLTSGAPFATGSIATLPLTGSIVVESLSEVRIQCASTSPDAFAQYAQLSAVKVETLSVQ